MVVYEDGRPRRNDYRKFKIKTVQGPNDYASMEEVLTRRFEHGLSEREELMAMETADGDPGNMERFGSFTRFPDLIMMDGRKGPGKRGPEGPGASGALHPGLRHGQGR